MSELDWLAGRRLHACIQNDYTWSFEFFPHAILVSECLWRLVEGGRIRITNEDHGHLFGHAEPVDACAIVNQTIAESLIVHVELRKGTLDLTLHFETGHVLQIFPSSAGYEAWNLYDANRVFVAVGGGTLATFNVPNMPKEGNSEFDPS